jgi:2,3-bisphosphoglycerate-independent phosphoglycerate mutase
VEPHGPGAEVLVDLIEKSREVLEEHPVNRARREAGKRPANRIWFWGQGKSPGMPTLRERYGLSGAAITAVDLIRGLAILSGMDPIDVPGATGYFDTDYENKAFYAARALRDHDLVFIHVEAPDEASHEGLVEEKIRALQNIDRVIVCRMLDELARLGTDYRILVLPDHPTPIEIRTHAAESVPFALYYPGVTPDGGTSFSEKGVSTGAWRDYPAWELLDLLTSE